MSHSRGRSSPGLDKKTTVVEVKGNSSEIDLTTCHEECAGRLVLDPKCVGGHFLLSSPKYVLPITSMQQRSMRRVWRDLGVTLEALPRRKDRPVAAAKR